jgi:hypothetical protein
VLTRRDFLAYFGGVTVATAAVYALPAALRNQGWWSAAYAEDADVVEDTFNGLAAMVWPGNDAYSKAQGEANDRPGAVAANTGRHVRHALDGLVAQPYMVRRDPRDRVPLSGSLASAINTVALGVNPIASGGGFSSPFARLPFAEKAEVWRILEQDSRAATDADSTHGLGVVQFLAGVLPAFVGFFAFSEIDVFDPATRRLTRRPVGWNHCGYLGERLDPPEGFDDFLGYYQGRTKAEG